jgi:hypothetical protein
MSNVAQRRATHEAINKLGHYTLARVVRQYFPAVPAKQISQLAKILVREAHNQVSPKKNQ